MSTESVIEAANRKMAVIADDMTLEDRRERLRAIWQPIAHALVDNAKAAASDSDIEARLSDPNFVGFTNDTKRPVFLEKETSPTGLVYRKFIIADARRSN